MRSSFSNRILLISANRHTDPYPVYPVGVSYLRTYLLQQKPDREVEVMDMNLSGLHQLRKKLLEFQPAHIGLSIRNIDDVNSTSREGFMAHYKDLVAIIRQHSSAWLTIGGAGYSIYPRKIFKVLEPDFAVQGEGELTYDQLIETLGQGISVASIEGLLYRDKEGKVQMNKRQNFLDQGTPRYMKDIIDHYWNSSGVIGVQTKRGSPFTCNYCTYPLIDGRKVRVFEPEEVADTLEYLKREHGVDHVFFTDAIFNIHNDKNIALAEELIRRHVSVNWAAYFSPTNVDEELLSLFQRAGLTHVEFGTDSLSDRQLKNYNKKFSVDQVVETSEICRRLEIYHAHFLILGGVGETQETLQESFKNSKRFKWTAFFPFVGMRIYPGTPLEKQAVEEGVIDASDDLLEPRYYLASAAEDLDQLKKQGKATGQRWIWPDEDHGPILSKLRKKGYKGPLWEFMIPEEGRCSGE